VYEERTSAISGATAWRAEHDGPVRVLPDGCMDLLWMHGSVVVAGPDEVAHVHGAASGEQVLGLRFRPGVLPSLLGVPAEQLVGLRVPLADLVHPARWWPLLSPDADPLEQPDPTHAFGAMAASALVRPEPCAERPDEWELVARALARGARVAELARSMGYSERQLSRRCRQHVGYGPAVLRRVLRFQRALAAARAGTPPARVAAQTGYADQSHLHRDARALAGVPLSALR
jgi:AraC-like DNA-binding protein